MQAINQKRRVETNMKPPTKDIAQQITETIIERLEKGVQPWERPWTFGPCSRPLRSCGTAYRGINCLDLWLTASHKGYASAHWMTFAQAQKLGGQVRKGEKSSPAVFYKVLGSDDANENDDDAFHVVRRVMRGYNVFNADQIEGLPARFYIEPIKHEEDPYADENRVRQFLEAIPITVRHGGTRAFFSIAQNYIQLPEIDRFNSFPSYASTRAHELIHATGHESRLNRTFGKRFGDQAYAFEELVAETGAAILGAELGLPNIMLDGHASYIGSWLKILKNDKNAIMTAAARAEEAVELLHTMAVASDTSFDKTKETVDA
jgi:antirestriction protein ArdC